LQGSAFAFAIPCTYNAITVFIGFDPIKMISICFPCLFIHYWDTLFNILDKCVYSQLTLNSIPNTIIKNPLVNQEDYATIETWPG